MYNVYVALHTGWGFIYRGCDVISTVVWWHTYLIWCYIECIWCYTYSGYDVIQMWAWYQWSSCDDKDTMGAMSDTVGVMSCVKWMQHHKYCGFMPWSGCDIICSANDVTHMPCGNNNTQCCVVIHSGYDVTQIVDRMSHVYCMWYLT